MNSVLSAHDQRILDTILGPNDILAPRKLIDESRRPDQWVPTEQVEKYVLLEANARELAQNNEIEKALGIFDKIITDSPLYASAYNNRAQTKRLLYPDEAAPEGVISDLKMAIKLSQPKAALLQISKMQALVLHNSYFQLAAVYLAQSKLPENWEKAWSLHMKSSEMMVEASVYGDHMSAAIGKIVNPYAQLNAETFETMMKPFY
ncbi:hypothetical protein DASB73_019640 [Starmerella bacillaris]|uniref:Tetratricopeptide repeat protein n=1 Tax=Starmerella bacillaris TaxID=1247836 RepID=A0AAV5RIM9_STABA|nr:hypothetical protein DASB73_019640 [Starmerella bacillaris]